MEDKGSWRFLLPVIGIGVGLPALLIGFGDPGAGPRMASSSLRAMHLGITVIGWCAWIAIVASVTARAVRLWTHWLPRVALPVYTRETHWADSMLDGLAHFVAGPTSPSRARLSDSGFELTDSASNSKESVIVHSEPEQVVPAGSSEASHPSFALLEFHAIYQSRRQIVQRAEGLAASATSGLHQGDRYPSTDAIAATHSSPAHRDNWGSDFQHVITAARLSVAVDVESTTEIPQAHPEVSEPAVTPEVITHAISASPLVRAEMKSKRHPGSPAASESHSVTRARIAELARIAESAHIGDSDRRDRTNEPGAESPVGKAPRAGEPLRAITDPEPADTDDLEDNLSNSLDLDDTDRENCRQRRVAEAEASRPGHALEDDLIEVSYITQEGDDLWSLSLRTYGDPSRWHVIADANSLNPLAPLPPHLTLALPQVPSEVARLLMPEEPVIEAPHPDESEPDEPEPHGSPGSHAAITEDESLAGSPTSEWSEENSDDADPVLEALSVAIPDDHELITVAPGDSLYGVADRQLGNDALWPSVIEANQLPNDAPIHPGQRLVIPRSRTLHDDGYAPTVPSHPATKYRHMPIGGLLAGAVLGMLARQQDAQLFARPLGRRLIHPSVEGQRFRSRLAQVGRERRGPLPTPATVVLGETKDGASILLDLLTHGVLPVCGPGPVDYHMSSIVMSLVLAPWSTRVKIGVCGPTNDYEFLGSEAIEYLGDWDTAEEAIHDWVGRPLESPHRLKPMTLVSNGAGATSSDVSAGAASPRHRVADTAFDGEAAPDIETEMVSGSDDDMQDESPVIRVVVGLTPPPDDTFDWLTERVDSWDNVAAVVAMTSDRVTSHHPDFISGTGASELAAAAEYQREVRIESASEARVGTLDFRPYLVTAGVRRYLGELLHLAHDPGTTKASWWGKTNARSRRRRRTDQDPLPAVSVDGAVSQPVLMMLGPIELKGARGPKPRTGLSVCEEFLAWILTHQGQSTAEMNRFLMVPESTRRSVLSRLKTMLGVDDHGEPFLTEVRALPSDRARPRIRLHPAVTSDWEQLQIIVGGSVARSDDQALKSALELVRGAPLEDAPAGHWLWAEEWRTDMISLVRDVGYELARRRLAAGDLVMARWAAAQASLAAPRDQLLLGIRIRIELATHQTRRARELARTLVSMAEQVGVELSPASRHILDECLSDSSESLSA